MPSRRLLAVKISGKKKDRTSATHLKKNLSFCFLNIHPLLGLALFTKTTTFNKSVDTDISATMNNWQRTGPESETQSEIRRQEKFDKFRINPRNPWQRIFVLINSKNFPELTSDFSDGYLRQFRFGFPAQPEEKNYQTKFKMSYW